ncbi:MAG: sigma-70 family RNA polymerase sigma factor [Bacteroidia bacterium]|nr:sigma-70 family RNA polymerase sigma factor [Bacteroidia bacterium]
MTSTAYSDYQKLLFPIAKNMLGNDSDAEDLVQETLFKWLTMAKKDIENIRGYLVKTLVNKCLNFIRDRKRESGKEVEVAPELLKNHLPAWIEHAHGLSLGMLALLEKLSATERAVFLLKEVFGYSHREIAELLGISEENSRQILARAKRHLKNDRQRFTADPDHHLELYQSFVQVIKGGDLGQLLEILREDIDLDIMRPAASLTGKQVVAEYLIQHLPVYGQFHLYMYKGLPLLTLYLLGKPFLQLKLWGNGEKLQRIEINPLKKREIIAPKMSV